MIDFSYKSQNALKKCTREDITRKHDTRLGIACLILFILVGLIGETIDSYYFNNITEGFKTTMIVFVALAILDLLAIFVVIGPKRKRAYLIRNVFDANYSDDEKRKKNRNHLKLVWASRKKEYEKNFNFSVNDKLIEERKSDALIFTNFMLPSLLEFHDFIKKLDNANIKRRIGFYMACDYMAALYLESENRPNENFVIFDRASKSDLALLKFFFYDRFIEFTKDDIFKYIKDNLDGLYVSNEYEYIRNLVLEGYREYANVFPPYMYEEDIPRDVIDNYYNRKN